MAGAISLCSLLKKHNDQIITSFIGSHVQALPKETMIKEKEIDIAFTNDGVYSLLNVLSLTNIKFENLKKIKGLCIRDLDNNVLPNSPERQFRKKNGYDLPGYAWDLLPYKNKPLDLYRAHFWHGNYDFQGILLQQYTFFRM